MNKQKESDIQIRNKQEGKTERKTMKRANKTDRHMKSNEKRQEILKISLKQKKRLNFFK